MNTQINLLSDDELDTVVGGGTGIGLRCPASDVPTGHIIQAPIGSFTVSCSGYPDNQGLVKVTYNPPSPA